MEGPKSRDGQDVGHQRTKGRLVSVGTRPPWRATEHETVESRLGTRHLV
jgi:hypothetical protein